MSVFLLMYDIYLFAVCIYILFFIGRQHCRIRALIVCKFSDQKYEILVWI